MIRKILAGWIDLPAIAVGLAVLGCSVNQGDGFVKFDDPVNDASSSKLESTPVYLDNSQGEVVKYVRLGESDPIRVTPTRPEESALTEQAEILSPMEEEFKSAVAPESLNLFIAKYAPDELAFLAVQKAAQLSIDAKNWTEATAVFDKYRDRFPAKTRFFDKISALLAEPSRGVVIRSLGSEVNSSEGEYAPVISSNGKKLFFARDCGVCAGGEEIFAASLTSSGIWSGVVKFGQPLLSGKNEIPLALSPDGNTLAIYGNYADSLGMGDIFHIDRTSDSWTNLQHYPSPLNSEYFDTNAMYAADGNAILFVSDRPGGVGEYHPKGKLYHADYNGNTDIYVFFPDAHSGGRVINLGSTINTPYAEYSPFLHPDGKTLYFSSNGHPGLGGLDVFKSTRLKPDSWTEWSDPENLGKEINTTYNDWGYQFTATGDIGYFSVGNRPDGYGGSDIFSVSLPGVYQPSSVISISGIVSDPGGKPLSADIRWNDMTIGKEVGHATSDPQTGEYIIHLPVGGQYTYYADKSGYMGESENIDLRDDLGYREYVKDIVLYPLRKPEMQSFGREVVAMIRMNNIFFDFNKANLRQESILELDRWVKMLHDNISVTIEIDGHTDSIGTDKYNQRLSEMRAQSVVNYLIKNGVEPVRMRAMGFGEKIPVDTNDTLEGRQNNRRVEVRIFN